MGLVLILIYTTRQLCLNYFNNLCLGTFGYDIIPKFALLDNEKILKNFKSTTFNMWSLIGIYILSLSKKVDVKKFLNRSLIDIYLLFFV